MKIDRRLIVAAGAAAGAALFAGLATASDLAGTSTGPNGPEAGVWVIAETKDLPTKFATHRRHRRPGPLPRARSSPRELRRVGARLRPGRFAEGEGDAGRAPGPHRGAGAERARGRAVLPGDVLVLDDARAARERFPASGRCRARRPGCTRSSRAAASPATRLARKACARCRISSARPARRRRWRPGASGVTAGSARAQMTLQMSRLGDAGLPVLRAVDRRDRERRAALRAARAAEGRRAQPRGDDLGLEPSRGITCTTSSPPTAAIRASTRTAASTARRKTAPTSCRSSIRARTARAPSCIRCATRRRRARATTRSGLRPTGASSRSGTAAR